MGFFDFLTGGDSKTEDVKYPDWYSDPNFTGSQDFLSQYSKDLLTSGPNAYYSPIGEYGTSQFQDYLKQTNASTMAGMDESLARTGRSRGGQAGQMAAQALGDRNANLAWQDYLRAMKGREMFFNTGLGVQQDVRNAGFNNQSAKNDFNVNGSIFNLEKAKYGDQYDANQSAGVGKFLGTLVGGAIGFMAGGGPMGALAGAGMGSDLMGGSSGSGTPAWLDALMKAKGTGTTGSASSADTFRGVSKMGAIDENFFKVPQALDFAALGM